MSIIRPDKKYNRLDLMGEVLKNRVAFDSGVKSVKRELVT